MQHRRIAFLVMGASVLASLGGCNAPPSSPHAAIVRPKCRAPVYLDDTGGPVAPGFIVALQDTVNTPVEAARLAEKYAFTPTAVLTAVHMVITPTVSDTTVAALRCEPTVISVSYNYLIKAD